MYFRNRGINPNMQYGNQMSFDEEYTAGEAEAIREAEYMDASLGTKPVDMTGGVIDDQFMIESAIVQQVEMMNDRERSEYLNSEEFQNLVEAGVVGRRAIVRMSRAADLDRRIHLLSLQMAKENGDADWEALRRNRIAERKLLDKIYKKYNNRVQQQATMSQKRLIKLSPRAFDLDAPIR